MANNLRSEGRYLDIPNIVETGVTITAGSFVRVDASGTGVIRVCSALAEASGFIGVLTETLTGDSTGVTIATEGVYEFVTEALATGSEVRVGLPVYMVGRETVRGFNDVATASTVTGLSPAGICVLLPQGPDTTATSVRCWVKIMPFNTLNSQLV